MQLKYIITIIFILKILISPQNKINNQKPNVINNNSIIKNEPPEVETIIENESDLPIGHISIPSINLKNNLYSPNSKHNNIEENVTILKDSLNLNTNNSIFILAAHSGNGQIAYFNNLDKLNIDDEIEIKYHNKKYTFSVIKIFEQQKKGYINIQKKEFSQLILTTCSKKDKNKQLIIECKIKESH